jgi:hypothetical protein
MIYLACTRFNDLTYYENISYRVKNNEKTIYGTTLKIRNIYPYGSFIFVAEMNKLGTSEKDNKRYEVLKAEREKNFKSILPYLEKAVEIKPDNDAAKRTLLSVYNALEMTDKYKALKAKM